MKLVCRVTVAAGLLLAGTAAHAQSLADVARQEQERRKAIKAPGVVYTDADVEKNAPLTTAAARPQPVPPAEVAGAGAVVPADAKPGAAAAAAKETGTPKDEAGWRDRMQQAREDVASSRRLLAAMEQQLVLLGLQASSAALAGQPATDGARQQEAAREVERLRAEVQKHSAALSRLEDEARAAGIPPGWLR